MKVLNRKPTEEERKKLLILNGMDAAEYSMYVAEPPLRDPDFQFEDDLYGFIVENKLIERYNLMVFGEDLEKANERFERIKEPMKQWVEELKIKHPNLFEGE